MEYIIPYGVLLSKLKIFLFFMLLIFPPLSVIKNESSDFTVFGIMWRVWMLFAGIKTSSEDNKIRGKNMKVKTSRTTISWGKKRKTLFHIPLLFLNLQLNDYRIYIIWKPTLSNSFTSQNHWMSLICKMKCPFFQKEKQRKIK